MREREGDDDDGAVLVVIEDKVDNVRRGSISRLNH